MHPGSPTALVDYLSRSTAQLTAAPDLPALARALHALLAEVAAPESAAIYLVEPSAVGAASGALRLYFGSGTGEDDARAGQVLRSGQLLHVSEVEIGRAHV